MIDDQNMKRKKYCTDQDEQFAPSDGEALTWCQAENPQATRERITAIQMKELHFFFRKIPSMGTMMM